MPSPIHTGRTLGAIVKQVAGLLGDDDPATPHTHWTREVLIGYANEALREILAQRPEAFAFTVDIPLRTGVVQQLPKEYQTLVTIEESWNGARQVPVLVADYKYARMFRKKVVSADFDGDPLNDYDVRTYTRHPIDDTLFYVEPPVPVGCKVRVLATLILRSKDLANADMSEPIPCKPEYEPQIIDWMLHRALSTEHESASAREQAKAHLEAFNAALDRKVKVHARVQDEAEDETPGSQEAQPQQRRAR